VPYVVKKKNIAYNSLRFSIIIRVLIITVSLFIIIFGYTVLKYIVTPSVFIIIVLFQIIELIYVIEKYFNKYNFLLRSIKHKDFTSTSLILPKDKILKEQKEVIAEIIDSFQNVRIEKENHYNYLITLVEHLNTGIVCFNESEKINLINTSAKKILGIENIQSLSSLKHINTHLYENFKNIKSGEGKTLKTICNNEACHLLIRNTDFVMRKKFYKLVSLQNIKQELDIKEQESWYKLIRILNHEVMNSMTPIVSLSKELNDTFFSESGEKVPIQNISDSDFEDIYLSTKTIEKRSQSLLNFVKSYRSFTSLPKPDLKEVLLNDIIIGVIKLLESKIRESGIQLIQYQPNSKFTIIVDKDMLEQVLINLLLNAIEAVNTQNNPKIIIDYGTENNEIFINIKDNGEGISAEYIDKIFVPFFTTKKKGSGIGLSLSKQIMIAHKGNIIVNSTIGKGSTCIIKIPNFD